MSRLVAVDAEALEEAVRYLRAHASFKRHQAETGYGGSGQSMREAAAKIDGYADALSKTYEVAPLTLAQAPEAKGPGLTVQDLDEYDEGTVISDREDVTWVKVQGETWRSVNGSMGPIGIVHHYSPLRVAAKHGTGEPLSAADLDAGGQGSIVVDRDGVEWVKGPRGWFPTVGGTSCHRALTSMYLVDHHRPIRRAR